MIFVAEFVRIQGFPGYLRTLTSSATLHNHQCRLILAHFHVIPSAMLDQLLLADVVNDASQDRRWPLDVRRPVGYGHEVTGIETEPPRIGGRRWPRR